MAETSDYTPSSYWEGHDYTESRRDYDVHAGRSYSEAKQSSKSEKDLVTPELTTESEDPFAFVADLTGSMAGWPGTLVSKVPYLEHQLMHEYLGENMEMAILGIGDAAVGDDYPLQVFPFAKGAEIKTRLDSLVIEKGGGRNNTESYELAALYLLKNVTMPKTARPIGVFVGDELPANSVSNATAKRFGIKMDESTITTSAIFKELANKGWSVYFVQKIPTGNGGNTDDEITEHWSKLVGADHVARLTEPERIVDVIFGLLASEKGKVAYFREEIERRQKPEQVATVYAALKNVLPKETGQKKLPYTVLTTKGATEGKKAQSLLPKK